MIKPFTIADLGYFMPNKYSIPDVAFDQLIDPNFEVQSMWDNGVVVAIIYYRNYWGDCWLGAFLIAEEFTSKQAVRLREWVREMLVKKNVRRLQTESVSCEELSAWHKFMGFTYEGTREKMLFECDYDMWAILRGVE